MSKANAKHNGLGPDELADSFRTMTMTTFVCRALKYLLMIGVLLVVGACSSSVNALPEHGLYSGRALDSQLIDEFGLFEDLKVACMSNQGFDYVPQTASEVGLVLALDDDVTAEDFAREHGWGISTLDISSGTNVVDPNEEILMALDPKERLAWQETYFGPFDSNDLGPPSEGCEAEAEAVMINTSSIASDRQLAQAAIQRFEADPKVVEFYDDWSRCIGQSGFEFARPNEAVLYFQDRASEVVNAIIDVFEQQLLDEGGSNGEVDPTIVQPPNPGNSTEYQVIEADERRFATASWDCDVQPPYFGVPEALSEVWASYVDSVGD